MSDNREITLYHWPQSRSAMTLLLLEELGAPYKLEVMPLARDKPKDARLLAVNPLGKLPTIRHGEAVVTEQVAIFLYLADLFPEAGLAPALTDPLRGPYLRWMVYYAASFEPGMMDVALKRQPAPEARMMLPYGDTESMLAALYGQLATGPYILGDRFTAADVLWGAALTWMTGFKLLPMTPLIAGYLERVTGRPAQQRAEAINARIMAEHTAEGAVRP